MLFLTILCLYMPEPTREVYTEPTPVDLDSFLENKPIAHIGTNSGGQYDRAFFSKRSNLFASFGADFNNPNTRTAYFGQSGVYILETGQFIPVMGRHLGAYIRRDNIGGRAVSAEHMLLIGQGDKYHIEDKESSNGTYFTKPHVMGENAPYGRMETNTPIGVVVLSPSVKSDVTITIAPGVNILAHWDPQRGVVVELPRELAGIREDVERFIDMGQNGQLTIGGQRGVQNKDLVGDRLTLDQPDLNVDHIRLIMLGRAICIQNIARSEVLVSYNNFQPEQAQTTPSSGSFGEDTGVLRPSIQAEFETLLSEGKTPEKAFTQLYAKYDALAARGDFGASKAMRILFEIRTRYKSAK